MQLSEKSGEGRKVTWLIIGPLVPVPHCYRSPLLLSSPSLPHPQHTTLLGKMIEALFIAPFILVTCIWLATWIQSHRLLYQFQFKYREKALAEIPHAFEAFAHPGKLLYFMRRSTRAFLRQDAELGPLSKQVWVLVNLSIAIPLGLALMIMAFIGVATFLEN